MVLFSVKPIHLLAIASVVCLSGAAPPPHKDPKNAKPVDVAKAAFLRHGFYSGNDYKASSPADRKSYITGFFDAISYSVMRGATDEALDKMCNNAAHMSNDQVTAIVDKYVEENPIELFNAMHQIIARAMLAPGVADQPPQK